MSRSRPTAAAVPAVRAVLAPPVAAGPLALGAPLFVVETSRGGEPVMNGETWQRVDLHAQEASITRRGRKP